MAYIIGAHYLLPPSRPARDLQSTPEQIWAKVLLYLKGVCARQQYEQCISDRYTTGSCTTRAISCETVNVRINALRAGQKIATADYLWFPWSFYRMYIHTRAAGGGNHMTREFNPASILSRAIGREFFIAVTASIAIGGTRGNDLWSFSSMPAARFPVCRNCAVILCVLCVCHCSIILCVRRRKWDIARVSLTSYRNVNINPAPRVTNDEGSFLEMQENNYKRKRYVSSEMCRETFTIKENLQDYFNHWT